MATAGLGVAAWDGFPRISILREQATQLEETLVSLDIGLHGFSAEAPFRIPLQTTRQFEFMVEGRAVTLGATTVECLRVSGSDETPVYVCGFAFAGQSADEQEVVQRLVNTLSKVIGDTQILINCSP